jgi:hypothetical protein
MNVEAFTVSQYEKELCFLLRAFDLKFLLKLTHFGGYLANYSLRICEFQLNTLAHLQLVRLYLIQSVFKSSWLPFSPELCLILRV